jgi:hypothetical protein
LVPELPSELQPEYVEFEEILTTFSPQDIALIKSLLEGEVQYYFHGEHFLHIQPFIQPARLMVRTDQAEHARAILRDVNLAYNLASQNVKSKKSRIDSDS